MSYLTTLEEKDTLFAIRGRAVDVKDHGADSTGTNDSKAAFDSAVAAATSLGKAIYVPAGTFRIASDLSLNVHVILEGILRPDDAVTITFESTFDAPLRQVFSNFGPDQGIFVLSSQLLPIYPQWFGAKGDDVTDDSAAFQAALDFSLAVIIPPGTYRVKNLVPNHDQLIRCVSQASVIKGFTQTDNIFHTTAYITGVEIRGGTWRNCRAVWYHNVGNSHAYCEFNQMWISHCDYGFYLITAVGDSWRECKFAVDMSQDNIGYGIYLPATGVGQTNMNRFENCDFLYFARAGIYIGGGPYVQVANRISGCWFEDASGIGIFLGGPTRGADIVDCYFESLGETRSVRNTNWQWVLSSSGTSEYYLQTAAAGNPDLPEPDAVLENSSAMVIGSVGSLAAGEWDWADNDTLGYKTIYVRLTDSTDPDAKAVDYLETSGCPDILMSGVSISNIRIQNSLFQITSTYTTHRIKTYNLAQCVAENNAVLLLEGQRFCRVESFSDLYRVYLHLNYLNCVGNQPDTYADRLFSRSGTQPVHWTGSLAGGVDSEHTEHLDHLMFYPNGVIPHPLRNTHTIAGTSTGTGETNLSQYNLAAGSLGQDGGFSILSTGKKTGGGGTKTISLKIQIGPSLTYITFHPAANNTNDWRLEGQLFQATLDVLGGSYTWTASGSGTNEYYLLRSGGNPAADINFRQPGVVWENQYAMTRGTAGSLAVGEWDWADNDTLGFSTIYARLSDESDPDSHASDTTYVQATHQRACMVGYDGTSVVYQQVDFLSLDTSLLTILYIAGQCASGGDQIIQYQRRIERL